MTYIVLITGANKGIGYGLVAKYLSRPDTTVIATVRQPSSPEATRLNELPKGEGSNIIIVKIESTSETDAQEAVSSLGGHQINHLDLVIANSGLFALHAFVEVSRIQTRDLIDHFNVNTAGTVRLFQATLPLLQKAEKPIFAYMSSGVGSISLQEHFAPPIGNYGASKAAMNLLIRRIHIENPDLIAVALHPGGVPTDNGRKAQEVLGFSDDMLTPIDVSIDGMVTKLDNATREETSGKFLAFDETPLTW